MSAVRAGGSGAAGAAPDADAVLPGAVLPGAVPGAVPSDLVLLAALDAVDVGLAVLGADGAVEHANALLRALLVDHPALPCAWASPSGVPVALRRADGSTAHLVVTRVDLPLPGDGRSLVTVRDVTAVQEGRRRQRASEERFRRSFESSPTGMALVSPGGRVLVVNAALGRFIGRPASALVGRALQDLAAPAEDLTWSGVDEEPDGPYERRFQQADGTPRWGSVSWAVVEEDDGEDLLLLQVEDVHERRAAQASLAHQALHDPLTGLANRRLVVEDLDHVLRGLSREPDREDLRVGVLFVDLDGFKAVNDAHGHAAGDALLREVGRRLEHVVRGRDRVARLGGDEFVVLATPPVSDEALEGLAARVLAEVARPVPWPREELRVTASIGLVAGRVGDDAERLLRQADVAMYRAKHRGKARFEVFGDALRAEVEGQQRDQAALRDALAQDGLRLHYQPVVDASTGELRAVEALARLRTADGGLVLPDRFVGVAEQSGLILALGRQVLDLAVAQAAAWRAAGTPVRVAVNVSGRQLSQPDLEEVVASVLQQHGLPPHLLELEITESILLEADPGTLAQLARLRRAGVRIAIDDFGTGYASLSYLHALPATTVKIDRSFVAGLPEDLRAAAIVRAVAGMARDIGIECVAEGVETPAQQEWLARHAPYALLQGFLLGRPDEAGRLRPGAVRPPAVVPAPTGGAR